LKIFCIVGTRPEFIKMFPVYKVLQEKLKTNADLTIKWINSSQHKDLLKDLEEFFGITSDYNFPLSKAVESKNRLANLHSEILKQATKLFEQEKPDLVFIQGDTITAQACGLAAFYQKIKIAHIEAGLRTWNINNPFPEELSRRILSQISDLNFAPELKAKKNLDIEKQIFKKKSFNFYTGNTVIDALSYSMNKILADDFNWQNSNYLEHPFDNKKLDLSEYLKNLKAKKYILFTSHRRENYLNNNGLNNIQNLINAIKRLANNRFTQEYEFVVMVHKNPDVKKIFKNFYKDCKKNNLKQIKFIDSVSYPAFLKLMANSHFIVTDSGGIQEEAPYLKKPVLVFRESTERIAGLELGLAKLIGTQESIVHGAILDLLTNEKSYNSMIEIGLQPYGDGLAAQRIVDASLLFLKK
jgi:UDP-N-acetylglucosamine 2-epimerase (non-hydrolysing)